MTLAVSTCHLEGWKKYGQRMADTWTRNWPAKTATSANPPPTSDEDFIQRVPDLNDITWLQEFKRQHPYKRPGAYNYRFDAARFAHKVAAVLEAASMESEHLIWVDADTVTHTPVPVSFIDSLLPRGDEYIAWLDRKGKYPECGFFILNCQHPRHREFLTALRAAYVTGSLFKMAEWHDSFVIQQLVEGMGLKTRSLSGKAGFNTSHPFINGLLGAYMDHLKGPRKQAGRSSGRDLKVERTENYWSKQ